MELSCWFDHINKHFLKTALYGSKKSEPKEQKGVRPIVHLRQSNELFSLDKYLKYCCLILNPAARGQHLNLQISVSARGLNCQKKIKYILKYGKIHLNPQASKVQKC